MHWPHRARFSQEKRQTKRWARRVTAWDPPAHASRAMYQFLFSSVFQPVPLPSPTFGTRSHFISSTPYTIRVCYGASPSTSATPWSSLISSLSLLQSDWPQGDRQQIEHASRCALREILGQTSYPTRSGSRRGEKLPSFPYPLALPYPPLMAIIFANFRLACQAHCFGDLLGIR